MQSSIPPPLASFLRSGKRNGVDDRALAELITSTAIHLTQSSVPAAVRFSKRMVSRTKSLSGEIPLASWRALGRASLMASEYKEAATAYQTARRLARHDQIAQGQIDRTLVDVCMYLGEFKEAEGYAQSARRIFSRHRNQAELAKLKVNLANLYHRQDRHVEAAALYRDAGAYFRSCSDTLSAARCDYNLANTCVQLFEFKRAEKLYGDCQAVYAAAGYELDALDARWGLAWLHLLEGKYHESLRELHECHEGYKKYGRPLRVATCELDRAEVYLQLALYSDARLAAARAERLCRSLKLRYELAKASFFRAIAAAALHESKEASRSLKRAEVLFSLEKNQGFRGAVALVKADLASSRTVARKTLRASLDCFDRAQLPLWRAIADLKTVHEESLTERALLSLSKNTAAHQLPHIFAGWQTALGDRAEKEGRRQAAFRHWRRAARKLDEVRAQLPPLGLRRADQRPQGSEPHRRLISALANENPAESLLWAERFKTAGLWQPVLATTSEDPVRQQVEAKLQALASEVARLSTSLYAGGKRSLSVNPSLQRMRMLQQNVRSELTRLERHEAVSKHSVHSEAGLLELYFQAGASQTVIHWHCSERDVIAFVVEGRTIRSIRIEDGVNKVRRLKTQLSFLLESASLAATHALSHDLDAEQALLGRAAEWLWHPLEIDLSRKKILLISEGELANIPWSALRHDNRPLIHDVVISQVTSIRHWDQALRRTSPMQGIEIVAGRRHDLPAIGDELAVIREYFPQSRLHDRATRAELLGLGSARIWHYAGHAILNSENPFYSRLELHDGPLFAADLRLRSVSVDLVVLAACRAAEEIAIPGDESSGFVRSFLEMGARNVIAGHWAVADRSTSQWMSHFYRHLAAGTTYIESARQAAVAVAETEASCYHWAAFTVFGAGS